MKTEILIVCPLMQRIMDELAEKYEAHRLWEADDRAALLAEIAPRVRGIATDGHHGASAELMDALPKLEVISCYGVGYDGIDVAAARERNITVTNTPGVLNDDVADLAIGLLLSVARAIPQGDRYVRDGRWPKEGIMALQTKFSGKTVGILGLGRIGKVIARRCAAFDCPVVYHGRSEQPDVDLPYYDNLVTMAADVDFLVAICPGGPATRNLINAEVLEALGPNGFLVNVARGSVVDEAALIDALRNGRIAAAGLDVFANEPNVPEELIGMHNVVLQPHVASATTETRRAMGDLTIENLDLHFAGQPVRTPV